MGTPGRYRPGGRLDSIESVSILIAPVRAAVDGEVVVFHRPRSPRPSTDRPSFDSRVARGNQLMSDSKKGSAAFRTSCFDMAWSTASGYGLIPFSSLRNPA